MIATVTEEQSLTWISLRQAVYTGLTKAFHRAEMELWLRDPGRECWLALEDNKAVGFLEASLRNIVDGCLSSPVGYIEGIYVAPEHRGKGLSRELIAAAEKWMREKGCTEMGTDAELGHEDSIAFHEAMGFKETFRIVEFRKPLQ